MSSWTLDISAGAFFLDFAWMGVLLVVSTYLRSKVSILQNYLIPANLLAGILGLILGANLLGCINFFSDRYLLICLRFCSSL